jgi:hypothetical protein
MESWYTNAANIVVPRLIPTTGQTTPTTPPMYDGIYTLVDVWRGDYGRGESGRLMFDTVKFDHEGKHDYWQIPSARMYVDNDPLYTAFESVNGMKRMRVRTENIIKFHLDPENIRESIHTHCDMLLEIAKTYEKPHSRDLLSFHFLGKHYDVVNRGTGLDIEIENINIDAINENGDLKLLIDKQGDELMSLYWAAAFAKIASLVIKNPNPKGYNQTKNDLISYIFDGKRVLYPHMDIAVNSTEKVWVFINRMSWDDYEVILLKHYSLKQKIPSIFKFREQRDGNLLALYGVDSQMEVFDSLKSIFSNLYRGLEVPSEYSGL